MCAPFDDGDRFTICDGCGSEIANVRPPTD